MAIICAPACGAVPTPPQAVTVVEASDPGSDPAPTTDPSVTMPVQDPCWPALSQLPEGLTLVTGFRHELPDCDHDCGGPLMLQARSLRYVSAEPARTLSIGAIEVGLQPSMYRSPPPAEGEGVVLRRVERLPAIVVEAAMRVGSVGVSVDSVGFESETVVALMNGFSLLGDQAWDKLAATAMPLPCRAVRLAPTDLPAGFSRYLAQLVKEPTCGPEGNTGPRILVSFVRSDPPLMLTVSIELAVGHTMPADILQTVGRRQGVAVETGEVRHPTV